MWIKAIVSTLLCFAVFHVMATADDEQQLRQLEKDLEAAMVSGNVEFLDQASADSFVFSHGDAWIEGGTPFLVEDKQQWLNAIAGKPYAFRNGETYAIQFHDDVALVTGNYSSGRTIPNAYIEFKVWYIRTYAKRDGRWLILSHYTAKGPDILKKEPIQ